MAVFLDKKINIFYNIKFRLIDTKYRHRVHIGLNNHNSLYFLLLFFNKPEKNLCWWGGEDIVIN